MSMLRCLTAVLGICRRAKNILLSEAIEALQKKVKKGKGVNKTVIADRQEKVGRVVEHCITHAITDDAKPDHFCFADFYFNQQYLLHPRWYELSC